MARFANLRAAIVYDEAMKRRKSGDNAGAAELLRKALALCPEHQQARRTLIETLAALGLKEEEATNSVVLQEQTIPPVPARILFPDGIEFLGLRISNKETGKSSSVEIDYYWKCPPTAASHRPVVFVHFLKNETICFQDDHTLLETSQPRDLQEQTFERVFIEHRLVSIPAVVSPDDFTITIGLYNPKDGKRLRPKTNLEQARQEVTLPVKLKTVRPG